MTQERFDNLMHWIAQAAINISEGKSNAFAAGCPAHNAMVALIDAVARGEVALVPAVRS